MSEQLTNYETGIRTQYPVVQEHVDALRAQTIQTVREAAALGAMIDEAGQHHQEKLWTWLRSMSLEMREDVIAIAMRAHRYQQRHPELADASQLTFALAAPVDKEQEDSGAPRAKEGGVAAQVFQRVQNVRAQIVKLRTTAPPDKWNALTRQMWKDALEPLIELYKEL